VIDWNPILKAKLIKQLRPILALLPHHRRRPKSRPRQTESRTPPTFKPTFSTKSAVSGRSDEGDPTAGRDPMCMSSATISAPIATVQLPAGASAGTRIASGALYASSCEISWLV
jgi:hypothetical protein